MKKKVKKYWGYLLVILVIASVIGYKQSRYNVGLLRDAPIWDLKDIEGNAFSSERLKGKVAVVNFWSMTCPPCWMAIPELVKVHEAYEDQNVAVVGISLDTNEPGKVRDFVKGSGMDYTILFGEVDVVERFGEFQAIPMTFLIDQDGKVVKTYVGVVSSYKIGLWIEKML